MFDIYLYDYLFIYAANNETRYSPSKILNSKNLLQHNSMLTSNCINRNTLRAQCLEYKLFVGQPFLKWL